MLFPTMECCTQRHCLGSGLQSPRTPMGIDGLHVISRVNPLLRIRLAIIFSKKKGISGQPNHLNVGLEHIPKNILVVEPSLWKIWVSQLGWCNFQLKGKDCSKPPSSIGLEHIQKHGNGMWNHYNLPIYPRYIHGKPIYPHANHGAGIFSYIEAPQMTQSCR